MKNKIRFRNTRVRCHFPSDQPSDFPTLQIVLVGTKADLKGDATQRNNPEDEDITQTEGEKLAKKIRATCYMETSSKTGDGIEEVFHETIKAAMGVGKKPR